jgi:hypothetical protein
MFGEYYERLVLFLPKLVSLANRFQLVRTENCNPKFHIKFVVPDWCRFPRMKCVCAETSGYERLNENFLDYQTVSEDKDNATNEKEVILEVSRQDTLDIILIPGGDSLLQRRRQLPDRHRREEPVRQRPLPAAGPQEQSVQERELEYSGALAGVRLG